MDANTCNKVRQMYDGLKKKNVDIPDMLDIAKIAEAIRAAGKTV